MSVPTNEPKVQVATCPKCNKVVKMAVMPLDKLSVKEFTKLMKDGCNLETYSLERARKSEMCFLDCDKSKTNKL